MNACCIGKGYVGKSTALAFGIEKFFTRHEANITLEEANECKYIFICLPTPTIDGKCFVDDILALLKQLSSFPRHVDNLYIIRSTVYPGFANRVQLELGINNIVSNPEFLSESTWEKDAKQPQLVVIGANEVKPREDLKALYMGRFKYMKPLMTDSITAELIKYVMNTWFATKTIYFNEIFDFANKIGANYEDIKLAVENHPWGAKNHTTIVYKGRRGVHGSCLPKDLYALSEMSGSEFLKMLIRLNSKYE